MSQATEEQLQQDQLHTIELRLSQFQNKQIIKMCVIQRKKPKASSYALEKECVDVEITKEHLEKCKSCSVCHENFKLGFKKYVVTGGDASALPCKHFFHDLCILEWLKNNNTCPMCRYELSSVDYEYEAQKWEKNKKDTDSSTSKNQNSEQKPSFSHMYG
ncbi:hypothetical protein RFI_00048 [Reticulomyxa filosa]|uniref:RING-type domain-containing protein n=1 Tax=Reticulomyxa filosa TaxID=46433 RepID=X6PG63_RETFI|nr:hypothetical protein RFI_00048 [Reticulomyxa filosa]|eukprot:ETO37014.1 hypothetical protein RFI_00048 [Reticulomyxa filosa]